MFRVAVYLRSSLMLSRPGALEQDVGEYGQEGEHEDRQFRRALDDVSVGAVFHLLDLCCCR
jgi:hypothetical protein